MKTITYIIGLLAIFTLLAGCTSSEVPPDPVFPGEDSDNLVGEAFFNEYPDWAAEPGNKLVVDPEHALKGNDVAIDFMNQEFIYKYYYVFNDHNSEWYRYEFDGEQIGSSNWLRNEGHDVNETWGSFMQLQDYPVAAFGCDRAGGDFECNDNKWLLNGFGLSTFDYHAEKLFLFAEKRTEYKTYQDVYYGSYENLFFGKYQKGEYLELNVSAFIENQSSMSYEQIEERMNNLAIDCGASDAVVSGVSWRVPDLPTYIPGRYTADANSQWCVFPTSGTYEVCVEYQDTHIDELNTANNRVCENIEVVEEGELALRNIGISGEHVLDGSQKKYLVNEPLEIGVTLTAKTHESVSDEKAKLFLEKVTLTNCGDVGDVLTNLEVSSTSYVDGFENEYGLSTSYVTQENETTCTFDTPGYKVICANLPAEDLYEYNNKWCQYFTVIEEPTPIDPVFPGE